MNKKILACFTVLLTIAMMLTPLAMAKPYANPKNNEKFESFATDFTPNIGQIVAAMANPEYIPSEENPNKVITSWVEEPMVAYTLTVDGIDYYQGSDFEYTGVATVTANGGPFAPAPPVGIINGKQNHFRVEYMYDFGEDDGGIEGTITMLALTTSGANRAMHIRSLQGTGDLQNVMIQATQGEGFTHVGYVSGWPDIPPA